MLRKVNSGRLYNSITRHNRLLVDYSKEESERKGNLTATYIFTMHSAELSLHTVKTDLRILAL